MTFKINFQVARCCLVLCLFLSLFLSVAQAEDGVALKTTVKSEVGSGDTSIVIKKGSPEAQKDFEVVTGTDSVAGEPKPNQAESYGSWKSECEKWKKEFRDNNQDNTVLAVGCGDPKMTLEPTGLRQYKSVASYKLRVRIRGN